MIWLQINLCKDWYKDVGSGKTVIAMIAAYYAYINGYQCALMAPTEILAKQHYNNFLDIFKNTNAELDC